MKLADLLEQDTKTLKHRGGCFSCPRKKKEFVPATLRETEIILVGEAPGETEVQLGEGFVGKSGKYLRNALKEVGITKYSLTNTIHCRPPDNRDPEPEEVSCCMNQHVMQEVTGYPLVVLVGNIAARAFFPNENVTHLRGNVAWHPDFPGQRFYTISHPAYILRSGEESGVALNFKRHIERLGRIAAGEPSRFKLLQGGTDEFFEHLRWAVQQRRLSIDVETNRLESWEPNAKLRSIALAATKDVALFAHEGEPWWNEVLQAVAGFLSNPRSVVIGHNLGFDLVWIESQTGIPVRAETILDTEVLYYHARGYQMISLKELTSRHGDGYRYLVSQPHKCKDLWLLGQYNAEDVVNPLQLADDGLKMLTRNQLDLMVRVAGPSSLALRRLTHNGVYFHIDRMRRMEQELKDETDRIIAAWQEADPRFIPGIHLSDSGFAKYALEIHGLEPLSRTKTGKPQLDEACLKEWIRKGAAVMQYALDKRKLDKKQSTYVAGYEKWLYSDGCVHPDYLNDVTDSGRTSARNPNYQNVVRDKKIRSFFGVRRPGHLFVQGDFSQIELRLAMCLANDPIGIAAYNAGEDLHAATARAMAGPNYSKTDRTNAKPVNFALIYGGSWRTLQAYAKDTYGILFTDQEAQKYADTFFGTYKYLTQWHELCNQELLKNTGWAESIVGHRFFYKDWNAQDSKARDHAFRAHINSKAQGPASYLLLYTLVLAQREFIDRKMDGVLTLGEVHDSIHIELPSQDLLPECMDVMQVSLNRVKDWVKHWFVVPLVMDFEAGPSWGEAEELGNSIAA